MTENETPRVNHQRQARVNLIGTVACLLGLAAAVYIASHAYVPVIGPLLDVATPFVIAIILALFLDPIVDKIQAKGLSRGAGVAIVGLSFLLICLLVGFLLIPRMASQVSQLASSYQSLATEAEQQIDGLLESHKEILQRLHLPTTFRALASQFSIQLETGAKASLDMLSGVLSNMFAHILWIIIIPLATFWFLRDWDPITRRIVSLTPERKRDKLVHTSGAVTKVFRGYVRGMATVAVLYSVFTSIWLTLAGLQYGLVIGAVSGLLYMIPYVGVLTTTVTVGILALIQPAHSPAYAVVLMGAVIIQSFVVFDVLVFPRVVGKSVGVHPLLALFSLVVGAKLFGLPGMIAAVPVTASIQVALTHLYPELFKPEETTPDGSDQTGEAT